MYPENGHIFLHELTVFYKIILHKVDTNENHCNLSDNRDQGNVLSGFHAYVYKNRYFYEIWRKEAWLQCVNVALYPITSLIRSCPFIQIFRIFIFLTAWPWKCSLRCTKIIIVSWHLNIWKVMPLCEVWIFFYLLSSSIPSGKNCVPYIQIPKLDKKDLKWRAEWIYSLLKRLLGIPSTSNSMKWKMISPLMLFPKVIGTLTGNL